MVTDKLLFVFLVILLFVILAMLFRVFYGPTVFDRLNGLTVIGTNSLVVLILIGFLEKRINMFVDIAISYGVLGFISLVVLAKYFEGKEDVES